MASLCRRVLFQGSNLCRSFVVCNKYVRHVQPFYRETSIVPGNTTFLRHYCPAQPQAKKETVTIHFMTRDGAKKTVSNAKVGDNLLDVIVENDVDIDGFGACEGTLACSTCHLIFKQEDYDKIAEKPTDEELDMLDLAYGLVETSRLGCQVIVTKDMEGMEVSVPAGVADARDV